MSGEAQFEGEIGSRVVKCSAPGAITNFLTLDNGDWLRLYGLDAKAEMYTLGDLIIAITMLRHDTRAGLSVPVRLGILSDGVSNKTSIAYDVPSTVTNNIGNDSDLAAARGLDAKLTALAEQATGVRA